MECPFREKKATIFIFVLHSAHLGRFVPQVTESSEVCRMIYLVTKHKTEGSCLLKRIQINQTMILLKGYSL